MNGLGQVFLVEAGSLLERFLVRLVLCFIYACHWSFFRRIGGFLVCTVVFFSWNPVFGLLQRSDAAGLTPYLPLLGVVVLVYPSPVKARVF